MLNMHMTNHVGKLLIAIPNTEHEAYVRGVMLVTNEWSKASSMVQLNRPMRNGLTVNAVMQASGIFSGIHSEPVFEGGPDELSRLQIIHSLDWQCSGTRVINDSIGTTTENTILAAIAAGDGPEYWRCVAGHRLLNNMPDHPSSIDGELSGLHPWRPGHRWLELPGTAENVFTEIGDRQWLRCVEEHTKQAVNNFF